MREEIALERRPPKQLEHFLAINEARISAELSEGLAYFFASWELPAIGWKHSLIPDALFSLGGHTFALEVDRGFESIRYFMRTKVGPYAAGLPGLYLSGGVLVVAHTATRCRSLARAIGTAHSGFMFTTLHAVQTLRMSDVLQSMGQKEVERA
jgi:hypothetical protein